MKTTALALAAALALLGVAGTAAAGPLDVTVDTTNFFMCVGPWTTETSVETEAGSVTVIHCDPHVGNPPT